MCVILYTVIDGKTILAKNRDRAYKPVVKIVHEIVDGIEVAYLRDEVTGWVEGMNAEGVGVVNSTLSRFDGKVPVKRRITKKGHIIYRLLTHPKQNIDDFKKLLRTTERETGLEGHTLIYHDGDLFHIENAVVHGKFVSEEIHEPTVYSNYGINIKDAGNTKCAKGLSAFLRADIIRSELKRNHITNEEELVDIMNRNYRNINTRFHPYRDKHVSRKENSNLDPTHLTVSTTGQLVLNMSDKEMVYYADVNNSNKVEYVNRLPRNYVPQIRVTIRETEKQLQPPRNIFTKKYLKTVYDRFQCKKTQTKKTQKTKTKKTKTQKKKRKT